MLIIFVMETMLNCETWVDEDILLKFKFLEEKFDLIWSISAKNCYRVGYFDRANINRKSDYIEVVVDGKSFV